MIVAASTARIDVNAVTAPNVATLAAGSSGVISVSGGPANAGDWIALYHEGAADTAYTDWRYLSDTTVAPATGLSAATLHFAMPVTAGNYEFRLFSDNGYGRLATSGTVIVQPPVAQIAVNGTLSPTSVASQPGAAVAVHVTGGPGNVADWVALAERSQPDALYVAWMYLNGGTTPPAQGPTDAQLTFNMPPSPGTYEVRLFANDSFSRLATSTGIVSSHGSAPTVTVTLIEPFSGTTFVSPASITLEASTSILGGTITRVDFYSGATLIGSSTVAPYQIVWTAPAVGLYALTAMATDNTGAVTGSQLVDVTVTNVGSGNGILGAPLASPPGGLYGASASVTLSAGSAATIRYTTDGSSPDESSLLYTGPITVSASGVLQARAFQSGWTSSAIMSAAYEIDDAPPLISAVLTPVANSAGWHNTAVTVSFECSDRSMTSCPKPVVVSTEGAGQLVSGTATDAWGHQATASVTINMDQSTPTVLLNSPDSPVTTTLSSISLMGYVSDALSGVVSVRCNDISAAVAGESASCDVPLLSGVNTVVLHTRDAAGNAASRGVRVTRSAPPTQLVLTPTSRTVRVGEVIRFAATSEVGASLEGVTWATSNAAIVDVSAVDGVTLTALAPGHVTVTATLDSLSSDASVTVLDQASWIPGTTRWMVEPTPDFVLDTSSVVYAHRVSPTGPDLFVIESSASTFEPQFIRAVRADGTTLWAENLPGVVHPWVAPPFGDVYGAVVAPVLDGNVVAFARFGGEDGVAPWRHDVQGYVVGQRAVQASDGTIYYVEEVAGTGPSWDGFIVGLDGATGAPKFRVPIPNQEYREIFTGTCANYPRAPYSLHTPYVLTAPAVGADDAAYVQVAQFTETWEPVCYTQFPTISEIVGAGTITITERTSLMRVDTSGSASFTTLREATSSGVDGPSVWHESVPRGIPGPVAFDDGGGALATWYVGRTTGCTLQGDSVVCADYTVETHVTRAASNSTVDDVLHTKSWVGDGTDFATPIQLVGDQGWA